MNVMVEEHVEKRLIAVTFLFLSEGACFYLFYACEVVITFIFLVALDLTERGSIKSLPVVEVRGGGGRTTECTCDRVRAEVGLRFVVGMW